METEVKEMEDKRWATFKYFDGEDSDERKIRDECSICGDIIPIDEQEQHRLNHLLLNIIETMGRMNKEIDEIRLVERTRQR